MNREIATLIERVQLATGSDSRLDADIFRCLNALQHDQADPPPPFTASIDRCIELHHRILPQWAWHVGFGPRGIVPYATVSNGEVRFEAAAATVPLALLQAMLEAKLSETMSER